VPGADVLADAGRGDAERAGAGFDGAFDVKPGRGGGERRGAGLRLLRAAVPRAANPSGAVPVWATTLTAVPRVATAAGLTPASMATLTAVPTVASPSGPVPPSGVAPVVQVLTAGRISARAIRFAPAAALLNPNVVAPGVAVNRAPRNRAAVSPDVPLTCPRIVVPVDAVSTCASVARPSAPTTRLPVVVVVIDVV
jgi:hypothetical protein